MGGFGGERGVVGRERLSVSGGKTWFGRDPGSRTPDRDWIIGGNPRSGGIWHGTSDLAWNLAGWDR